MKIISAIATALTLLATTVSAYEYVDFPKTITCPNNDPVKQSALEKAARRAKEADQPYEEHASNLASGKCATLDLPYYVQDVGEAGVAVGVAYDEGRKTFYYCLHTDPNFNCQENY